LIGIYAGKKRSNEKKWSSIAEELDDCSDSSADNSISDGDVSSPNDMNRIEDDCCDVDGDELNLTKENGSTASREKEMSIEYLENDVDVFHIVDDWDGIHLSINLDHVRCCIILAGCKNMP
jgi:Werner syndrome ATP-dependent helicase